MLVAEADAVIISELLFYIQNRIKVTAKEIIIQICAKVFSADEIENEKSKFFEAINVRSTKRNKGPEQITKNLGDIIDKMYELDSSKTTIPSFVARDLNNLPSLTYLL
jgi:hypothetical protein